MDLKTEINTNQSFSEFISGVQNEVTLNQKRTQRDSNPEFFSLESEICEKTNIFPKS